jgi:hypothetical protein
MTKLKTSQIKEDMISISLNIVRMGDKSLCPKTLKASLSKKPLKLICKQTRIIKLRRQI